ncbi:MAG TPA: thioredoxin domain-containing protein [Vicingaceae bacterium]|jgi:thioredoxin|nr:thioredoxin domain-containing protein [Vicingaceae bacterium]
MLRFNLFILAAWLLTSCGNSQNETTTPSNEATATESTTQEEVFIKNVDAATFKNLTETGNGIILDVRTPEEIASGHIPNASIINIYDKDFEAKINLMQKDKEIYVYCKSGGRSGQAAELLQKNGFNKVYNLDGGIMAWEKNNFPLTEPSDTEDHNIKTVSLADFKTMITTDQPVLVDFHTVWCAPCKKMAPVIDEIETAYTEKAVVKRIDIDKSKEVAEAYEISGVPVFIIFVNGQEKWKHNGMISKEELTAELDKYIAQ